MSDQTPKAYTLDPQTIEALIQLAAQYGPAVVVGLMGLFKKADPAPADVVDLFNEVLPLSAFGLPTKVPAGSPVDPPKAA